MTNTEADRRSRVVVLGGGRIGTAVAALLQAAGGYDVTLADQHEPHPAAVPDGVEVRCVDATSPAALEAVLAGVDVAVNALPFALTRAVAAAAVATGTSALDLTEDVASTRAVHELAADASCVLVPQCGLAPGFVSIAAAGLAARFDEVERLALRVGALPRLPSDALGYRLTWSTEGVINEYLNDAVAIHGGVRVEVPALEHVEALVIDGCRYEAFNTSGGLGSLCDTFAGRVRELDYKSIRYPGHRDAMKLLLHDLRLAEHRDELRTILERAIPTTTDDVVVVLVAATGWRDGALVEETFARTIGPQQVAGRRLSAIQATTAASACAVVDLLVAGELGARGLVRQEDVPLDAFLANRFGSLYATGVLDPRVSHGPAGRVAPVATAAVPTMATAVA